MKKQSYLLSPLIFILVLIASGCENNDTADQTETAVQESTRPTGQKNRLKINI